MCYNYTCKTLQPTIPSKMIGLNGSLLKITALKVKIFRNYLIFKNYHFVTFQSRVHLITTLNAEMENVFC